jgi:isopenicillin N synthase-like dioxygenase
MNITDLETKGFVGVSYPKDLRLAVEKTEESWKLFCELPLATKKAFSYSNSSAGVGYEMKDGSGPAGDLKENFDFALSGLAGLEALLQSFDYESAKPLRRFIRDAELLVETMTPFIVKFAIECEKTFTMKGFGQEIKEGQDSFFVRFIHYPPQKEKGKSTAQAHPDQSGFTLHLFESDPGLECLTYDDSWIPMPVSESETVIIPDMQMQLRSEGRLRALWHRVVANKKTAEKGRYSAVSFVQFKDTPKYDKTAHGRLQEKSEGFNYDMTHEQFARFFK